MFGIRCNHEIIAPRRSEFSEDGKIIRHLWRGLVRLLSSVSHRRKIGEGSYDAGGYISRSDREEGCLGRITLKVIRLSQVRPGTKRKTPETTVCRLSRHWRYVGQIL